MNDYEKMMNDEWEYIYMLEILNVLKNIERGKITWDNKVCSIKNVDIIVNYESCELNDLQIEIYGTKIKIKYKKNKVVLDKLFPKKKNKVDFFVSIGCFFINGRNFENLLSSLGKYASNMLVEYEKIGTPIERFIKNGLNEKKEEQD